MTVDELYYIFDPENVPCDIKPEKYYFVTFTMIRVLKRSSQAEGRTALSATKTREGTLPASRKF